MKLRPEARMQARENRKASKARLLMDQKQMEQGKCGQKKVKKMKKDCFTFFKSLKTKSRNRNEPERTGL
ncbi:MAG: hypothetical protein ACRD2P_06590 [Terriglobia bacterium]